MTKAEIAKQTLEIIEAGHYECNGKTVPIGLSAEQVKDVKVISPSRVRECVETADRGGFTKRASTEVYADSLETFESVRVNGKGKTIALNFANAYHVGGGFLNGATAQEENLCRLSTLYASISSDKAKEVYEHNKTTGMPTGSDYILISPTVAIFRDTDHSFLDKPIITSIVTSAAPDMRDDAADLTREQAAELMREKIKNVIAVCAAENADTLVLGAWGCGAFGHNPKTVAGLFREVLFDRGYKNYFDRVVFSVYSPKGILLSNTVNFINVFGKK